MAYQCVDRECFVEHKYVSHCVVFVPDSSPNCSIPCTLESCTKKIVNEILCPVYHCAFFTPSTLDPIDSTTTKPMPQPQPQFDTTTIVSLSVNLLFAVALSFILCRFLKKLIRKRRDSAERRHLLDQRQRMNNPIVRFCVLENEANNDLQQDPGDNFQIAIENCNFQNP